MSARKAGGGGGQGQTQLPSPGWKNALTDVKGVVRTRHPGYVEVEIRCDASRLARISSSGSRAVGRFRHGVGLAAKAEQRHPVVRHQAQLHQVGLCLF